MSYHDPRDDQFTTTFFLFGLLMIVLVAMVAR